MFIRMFVLLLFAATSVFAQVERPAQQQRDRGWVTVGGGKAPSSIVSGLVSVNVGRTHILQLFSQFDLLAERPDIVGLGYGQSRIWARSRYALTLGLGYVREAPSSEAFAPGLYANAQAILPTLPQLGLGLDVFGVLSPERSGVGLHLTFVFEGYQ